MIDSQPGVHGEPQMGWLTHDNPNPNFDDVPDEFDGELFIIWTTKDGRRIWVRDMEDSHLINARNMMQRKLDQLEADIAAHPHLNQAFVYAYQIYHTEGWIKAFDEEIKRRT